MPILFYEGQLKRMFEGTAGFTDVQRDQFIKMYYAYVTVHGHAPLAADLADLKRTAATVR